jgi:predicted DNA binding CopG/RHH family protein
MPKGGLTYASREACLAQARKLNKDTSPCMNLPSADVNRVKNTAGSGEGIAANMKGAPTLKGPKY